MSERDRTPQAIIVAAVGDGVAGWRAREFADDVLDRLEEAGFAVVPRNARPDGAA